MDGILLVDKPPGVTSFGVVDRLKNRFSLKKIGHGGTLDPPATGLLVVLVGRATKSASGILEGDKLYRAELLFGRTTDTQDTTGKTIRQADYSAVTEKKLRSALDCFRGEIDQVPPMVSALKFRGRRLYELARMGVEVSRPVRRVVVREIELTYLSLPAAGLMVRCSKGTYIRTICHDLGEKLGCGACLAGLRRLVSGPFRIEDAMPLDRLLELDREALGKLLLPTAPRFSV